jgi:deazaflavin-dependent oxidoreductase (nitroreductase family)
LPTQACEQAHGLAWFGLHASKGVTTYSGGQFTAPAGPMASLMAGSASAERMIVVMTTISDPRQRVFAHGDVIDITTTGRRTGQPRRIEIVYHVMDGRIYISGSPRRQRRSWLANLDANPHFTFHVKRGPKTDLPATARIIEDPDERRTVMDYIIRSAWHGQNLDAMVAYSPLIEVTLDPAA